MDAARRSRPLSDFPRRATDPAKVLVVDPDPQARAIICAFVRDDGHECAEALDMNHASMHLLTHHVSVVFLSLPPEDSEMAWLFACQNSSPEAAVIAVLGAHDRALARSALTAGASGVVAKPLREENVQSQLLIALAIRHRRDSARFELAAVQEELERARGVLGVLPLEVIERLVTATWLRDGETGAHVSRIRRYTTVLAAAMGYGKVEAELLGNAAVLHDIGKIAVPDAILRKPGALTPAERRVMEQHTVVGAKVLGPTALGAASGHAEVPVLALAASVALSHHERWDGTGYPHALHGEACPQPARIVGLLDVFDALAHARVYKQAWDDDRITAYFAAERGKQFDPAIVDAFFETRPALLAVRDALKDDGPAF